MEKTANSRIWLMRDFQADIKDVKAITKKNYSGIVIHHAECFQRDGAKDMVFDIDGWHVGKGWSGIGYAFVVERSGRVYATYRFTTALKQAHCLGTVELNGKDAVINEDFLGICLAGDGEKQEMSREQLLSLRDLVYALVSNYPIIRNGIFPHAIFSGEKICPGYMFYREIFEVQNHVKELWHG